MVFFCLLIKNQGYWFFGESLNEFKKVLLKIILTNFIAKI